LILVWSGSLLYLAIGEGAFLLASLLARRPTLLAIQARSTALSALAIAPWVWTAPTPPGGPFTTTTLSWIHPLGLLAVAAISLGLWWIERTRPLPSAGASIARAAGLVIVGCTLALCLPAVREAAFPGLTFLAKADTWGPRNQEQVPLFSSLHPLRVGRGSFGWWSFAIPLAPFAFLAARRIGLPVRAFLALWCGCLGALTIGQVRFASDFAPIACVAIALSLDQLRVRLATRVPSTLAWFGCIALGLALSWAPIHGSLAVQLKRAQRVRALPDGADPALYTASATMVRFAQIVRAHTPETSGYFDPETRPEYGILTKPTFGHVFSYVARRATPASGFGPYLDEEKYRAALSFYGARNREEALSIFDSLGTRYVVTHARTQSTRVTYRDFLHRLDGSSRDGTQHTGEFRLIAEGPKGGMPLSWTGLQRYRWSVPYKLFERVPGAVLEVSVPPGTSFAVQLQLQTNINRRFAYRARTTAGASGVARLRVPYATDTDEGTRALRPYRVVIGDDAPLRIEVRDEEVRSGAIVKLAPRTARN
jgi:hypothetical protein